MAKHIYLETALSDDIYSYEMSKLSGSHFEKIDENYDKAIITSVISDFINGQKYWCVEIVETMSFPIITYYHFKHFNDLISIYYAKGYKFIFKGVKEINTTQV